MSADEQPARSIVVDAFGVHVGVRVSGDRADEVLDRLEELWECCPVPAGAFAAHRRPRTREWSSARASGSR